MSGTAPGAMVYRKPVIPPELVDLIGKLRSEDTELCNEAAGAIQHLAEIVAFASASTFALKWPGFEAGGWFAE